MRRISTQYGIGDIDVHMYTKYEVSMFNPVASRGVHRHQRR